MFPPFHFQFLFLQSNSCRFDVVGSLIRGARPSPCGVLLLRFLGDNHSICLCTVGSEFHFSPLCGWDSLKGPQPKTLQNHRKYLIQMLPVQWVTRYLITENTLKIKLSFFKASFKEQYSLYEFLKLLYGSLKMKKSAKTGPNVLLILGKY